MGVIFAIYRRKATRNNISTTTNVSYATNAVMATNPAYESKDATLQSLYSPSKVKSLETLDETYEIDYIIPSSDWLNVPPTAGEDHTSPQPSVEEYDYVIPYL